MTASANPLPNQRIALIVGVTGGIGSETAKALLAHGWTVRALTRDTERAMRHFARLGPIDWRKGDAMDRGAYVAAARDASLIVHAANPPGYKNWRGLAMPMLENAIAAAQASGARLVFPGNVYNFGPDAGSLVGETAPQNPLTRKGAIRVEMERMLADAAKKGVRSLVVRAGDFFGPYGPSTWFQTGFIKPGKALRSVTYPGSREVGHAWAYLPDLGETIARLAEVEMRLPAFDVYHFGGHWTPRGVEIAEAIRRAAGKPAMPIRGLPWFAIYLAAPFVTMFREMLEMRYLWRRPLRLDNRKLVGLLGAEPHTPLDEAVRHSLAALGCLPEESPHGAVASRREA